MDTPTVPPRKKQPRWLLPLTLLLAAVFLYLAVRNVDWQETLATLRGSNLSLIGAALLVFSLSCVARGLRWRVLLSAEKRLPASMVFWCMMMGYLGNSYLPARAGEIIRSVAIGYRSGISTSFVLATALTERIADAVILVVVGTAALASMGTVPAELVTPLRLMAVVGAVGAIAIFLAPRMHGLVQAIITRLPLKPALRETLGGMAQNFLTGAGALQHPGRLGMFLFYSLILWSLDTVTGLLVARSLGVALNPAQVFVLLAALGIASALPSTPGYIGVYQLVARAVLVPFGLTNSQSLAYILAFQGTMYAGITLWGLIGLWNPRARRRVPAAEA